MRTSTRFTALSAMLVAGLTLTSCGGAQPASDGQANPDVTVAEAELVAGGTVKQIVALDMLSLDPAKLTANNPNLLASYFNMVYGQLLVRDAFTGEVSGGIAASMEPNEDNTVWTLTLNDGVTFTDGTPLDAEAVKANWDRLADPETAAFAGEFARALQTRVIDEATLEVTVDEPNAYLDGEVAAQVNYIASPTAIEENPNVFTTDPVGAGPYVLGESVAGSHHVFERNEDYFEEDQPYLDSITLQVQGDRQQQIDNLTSGGAGAAILGSWDVIDVLGERLSVSDQEAGGARMAVFNAASAPFDDARARRALALAIDADALAKIHDVGSGSAVATSLFADTSPYYSEDRTLPSQNAQEAQKLFDELAADGKPLDFRLTTAGPGGTRAAEWLQQELGQFDNVSVELDVIPIPNFDEQVTVRDDFDVAFYPGPLQVKAPAPDLTSLLRTDGSRNIANYSSAEMDAALADLKATKDPAATESALDRVHDIYVEDMPYFAYGNAVLGTLTNPELKNVAAFEEGAILWQQVSW